MRETVAIIGGGVAGLSAAHELVERGFIVRVYERRAFAGGKAASYRFKRKTEAEAKSDPTGMAAAKGTSGDGELPCEHGFRFFPGWYRHLTDTMSRIPYQRSPSGLYQGGTVADNLVSVKSNLLAWFDRPAVALPLRAPRSASEVGVVSNFLSEFGQLGLSSGEIGLFVRKLIQFLILPDAQRIEKFESVTWWDYLECGAEGRSRAYKDLVRATTRTMVAAKAEEASAYSIGRLVVRTLMDALSSVDRVLNGPTNEVWIEPWVKYLESRGVKFYREMELQSIEFDSRSRRAKRVVLESVAVANARRLRRLITNGLKEGVAPHKEVLTSIRELLEPLRESLMENPSSKFAASFDQGRSALVEVKAACDSLDALQKSAILSKTSVVELRRLVAPLEIFESRVDALHEAEADYFVFALPLEQMAYYINRSTMLTFLAPELRNLVRLSRHMDWMAGIQFYLRDPVEIAPGHLVGMDSTWSLTAIEQTQFWKDVSLPDGIKAILSVDIAAWDQRGRTIRKEAFNCSDDEIAEEVWAQLKEMLNKPGRPEVLNERMLAGGKLIRSLSYHVDDSIVDLRDRKKQASYERARGVKFSTLDLIQQGDEGLTEDGYMWGPPRARFNTEPLLVNRAGSRALRPEARSGIPNVFLAGDYLKTETDLACMEGANESARHAVNGILDATASRERRCPIWPFSPAQQVTGGLNVTVALRQIGEAAGAMTAVKNRFWKGLATRLLQPPGGPDGPYNTGS